MKEINALDAIKAFRDKYATTTEAATALGVSVQYLSDILNGRRDVSPRLLAQLGLKRIIVAGRKTA